MLSLKAVTKHFRARGGKRVMALRHVDMQVQAGEFVMVVGPSGSGKSTLLFTIGGMQKPDEGSVVFDEISLYKLSAARRAALRRARIGFVFQTFNLIPYLNCIDNVALPAILEGYHREDSRVRAREILCRLNLDHRLKHHPSELSVGERQRVALGRSLINDPEVILADEPTGNLDASLAGEVITILREFNESGQTIIMVTHDLNLAQEGTRIVNIHGGAVVDDRIPGRAAASA